MNYTDITHFDKIPWFVGGLSLNLKYLMRCRVGIRHLPFGIPRLGYSWLVSFEIKGSILNYLLYPNLDYFSVSSPKSLQNTFNFAIFWGLCFFGFFLGGGGVIVTQLHTTCIVKSLMQFVSCFD